MHLYRFGDYGARLYRNGDCADWVFQCCGAIERIFGCHLRRSTVAVYL
jgi:hypothetical protein